MELIRTPSFGKGFIDLPHAIQRLCERQLVLLAHDRNDPRLHLKPLKGKTGVYSFRITRQYRGLFYINEQKQIIVFAIGHRKDVYR